MLQAAKRAGAIASMTTRDGNPQAVRGQNAAPTVEDPSHPTTHHLRRFRLWPGVVGGWSWRAGLVMAFAWVAISAATSAATS